MKPVGLQVTRAHSPSRTALQRSFGLATVSGTAPSHETGIFGAALGAAVAVVVAAAVAVEVAPAGGPAWAVPNPRTSPSTSPSDT